MFYETKKLRDKNMYIITHVGSDKHRHPIFKEEYSWLDSQLINFFLYHKVPPAIEKAIEYALRIYGARSARQLGMALLTIYWENHQVITQAVVDRIFEMQFGPHAAKGLREMEKMLRYE